MGRPSRFSSSPCVKNSSMHISVHARLSCRGLAGFAMSAVCRASPMAKRASSRLQPGWNPSLCSLVLNLEVCSKWYFMSVASTSWTMVLRNSLNWSLERRVKKLHSSVW
eukprot:scaffold64922_cov63-Phaeocystis_antarctica.AAC.2